jgi:hypothetical protein
MSSLIRRVVVLVVLVGALAAVCGWLAVRADDARPAPTTSGPPATSIDPEASAEPTGEPGEAPADGSWREIAMAYSAALTDRRGGLRAWLRRLSPLVSRPLLDSYRDTDLTELPTGRPVRVRLLRPASTSAAAQQGNRLRTVRTTFDSGYELDVRLALLGGHWQVTSSGEHLSRKREGPALSGL